MTRLIVEALGQVESERLTVSEGDCVLVGRAPDPARVAGSLLPDDLQLRACGVPLPSVSANHAAVWLAGGRVSLLDLHSRNGTWVRLPRGLVVQLPEDGDVHVRLGASVSEAGTDAQPDPPRYLDRTDYGTGLAHSVTVWLQRHDVPARAWAEPREKAGEGPTGVTSLPLANGDVLFVQIERTADISFHERMSQISRFVTNQNALYAAEEETRSDGMILAAASIRQVHRRVVELAMQSVPSIILLGPSGTGKERLAQAYHRHLGRSGALVTINCATLSRDRIIADLFGAEAGAYTDAKRPTTGAVERADGGTLFLDELGELPLEVQPSLLRFIETGEYQRLGAAGRSRFADVRVVAATNRDLRQMVRDGQFREDLFFRLALEIVEIPPLAERFPDVEAYLKSRMLGETSAYDALESAGLELLRGYSWPGNFRELMSFVRRLPSSVKSSLGVEATRRALEAGALSPLTRRPPGVTEEPSAGTWLDWLRASADAFSRSMHHDGPRSWDEMSTYIEQFLKPWALAHLAGVDGCRTIEDISVNEVARRVEADRGTVVKQLRRYFGRVDDR